MLIFLVTIAMVGTTSRSALHPQPSVFSSLISTCACGVLLSQIVFSSGIYYAELTEDGCREGEWEVAGTKEVCEEGSNGWERVEGSNAGLFTKNGIQVQCWCASENPFVR